MAITIIGIIIGTMIFGAGIYYLAKEKTDREARKIYTITTVAGGAHTRRGDPETRSGKMTHKQQIAPARHSRAGANSFFRFSAWA